jgi:hypothetical protein
MRHIGQDAQRCGCPPHGNPQGRAIFRHCGVERLDRGAATLFAALLALTENDSVRVDQYGRERL